MPGTRVRDVIALGLLADREPADASNHGYLYFATDDGTGTLARSNGEEWEDIAVLTTIGTDVPAFDDARFYSLGINDQTADYTLVLEDGFPDPQHIRITHADPKTLTIPANADVAFPIGQIIEGSQGGAGTVTIEGDAGVTVHSLGAALTTTGQYASFAMMKTATNTWLVKGELE